MLTQILTYHQVTPGYLDFLHAFGAQGNPRGQYFAGFCHQTMIEDNLQAPKMVGRSWRQYQMCYNLRGVAPTKGRDGKITEWSVRQAAIHHQFDVVHGTAVWIVTKGRKDILERFDQLTKQSPALSFESSQDCFKTSLEVHRMFYHWSTEDWRQYIDWLEDGLESNTSLALYGSQESTTSRPTYRPRDLQEIQIWKEKTSQATMLLESNADVMTALQTYYVKLLANEDFPLKFECQKSIQRFAADVDGNIVWIKMQVRRLNLLAEVIGDRKNLTFFSTDVVNYQNDNSTESGTGTSTTSYSHLAMMRWLQVTLPLTLVTILGAWMAFKTATISQKGSEMKDSLVDRKNKVATRWDLRRKLRDLERGKS
ncbi:unnamed protein product [Aureobasidium vineae]|uniref:CorA-like transporter domain-containing protein n=1 Tax=Aureobasidium vineae TaxID=2773715 RepID=A0A9N8JVM6_9PEZI|nr:unnamed protein product [Aureobasidium vineae]